MKLVFDIEADGLFDTATTIWCLVIQDADTKKIYSYSDFDDDLPALADGLKMLERASILIGHNIINYDIPVIRKITGVDLMDANCHDTLVMSRTNRYKRPFIGHSLKAWGEFLGDNKLDYNDWSQYTKEMLTYCIQDVELNTQVYEIVLDEAKKLIALNQLYAKGLRLEHDIAKINVGIREEGWNFDLEQAKKTYARMEKRMEEIESIIHPQLGQREVFIDKEDKTPKYKKDGTLTAASQRMLEQYHGRPITEADYYPGMTFRRSQMKQIDLGQIEHVKEWLTSIGWRPDEYTRKKIDGRWVNQGPKLTTSSLAELGDIGLMVGEYYTIRSRKAVIEGWIEQTEASKDGRLHGDMVTIGTPSFRCRHQYIVNIPAVDAEWGKEMRELFKADKGDVLIGADSSGNQLRGLVHYVNDPEYTDVVINGDQHQRNADILGCTRSAAKTFLYCYLFGGGDAKLGQAISGKLDSKLGAGAKEEFAKGIKGLKELRDSVEGSWRHREHQQGVGWIFGLDGRPLFVPAEHQCLNYLLQCAEGITCKAAAVWFYNKVKEEGLRAKIRIFYHDEIQVSCHPDDADRVQELAAASFREAPKDFGVMVMDGDACRGNNYAETH